MAKLKDLPKSENSVDQSMATIPEDLIHFKPMSLSPCGNYFANSTLTGQLNVWDSITNQLVAQYVPTSHLSANCTRITWPPDLNKNLQNGHSNQSGDIGDELRKLSILAMGTENGIIFLFSVQRNEVYSILGDPSNNNCHTERINDICWPFSGSNLDSLFSCSNDKSVIEWSLSKAKIKRRVKLDNSIITSICALDTENIVTGSNLVKWWNWPNRQLLKTFVGHSSEVRFLRPIVFSESQDSKYVLSSAVCDRFINLWKLDDKSLTTPETATKSSRNFLLDDEPFSLECSSVESVLFIMTVSRTGYLYFFEYFLNETGFTGPKAPKFRLEIQTRISSDSLSNDENRKSATPKNKWKRTKLEKSIPFLYANMKRNQIKSKNNIQLLYGIVNRPTFEVMSIEECERLCQTSKQNFGVLIKDSSILKGMEQLAKPNVVNMSTNTKIKTLKASQQQKVTVIGPAGMVPHQPLFNNINGKVYDEETKNESEDLNQKEDLNNNNLEKISSKRSNSISELTLDEQLKKLESSENKKLDQQQISSKRKSTSAHPVQSSDLTESLVSVLVQGLQSSDERMLSTSLRNKENSDTIIANTIKKLPTEYVPKLLLELQKGLCQGGEHHQLYLKWITTLLRYKLSYLLTIPNISLEFLPLKQLLQARTSMLDKFFQLKGRLDLILTHAKPNFRNQKLSFEAPKLTYESESSEDDEEEEEMSVDGNDLMEGQDDDEENEFEDEDIEGGEATSDDEEDSNTEKDQRVRRKRPQESDDDEMDEMEDDDQD